MQRDQKRHGGWNTSMALGHVFASPPLPPPASLVRTDPEAGQAEDAHAREGFARDAPCRIKPSRGGNCTAVGQGAAPSLWSCSE